MKKKQIIRFKIIALILFSSPWVMAKNLKVEEMILEPALSQTALDQEHEFTVRGGTPPYIFKTSAGMIRYKDNTATYIAPSFPGTATVTVQDAKGFTKAIVITVMPDESVNGASE